MSVASDARKSCSNCTLSKSWPINTSLLPLSPHTGSHSALDSISDLISVFLRISVNHVQVFNPQYPCTSISFLRPAFAKMSASSGCEANQNVPFARKCLDASLVRMHGNVLDGKGGVQ